MTTDQSEAVTHLAAGEGTRVYTLVILAGALGATVRVLVALPGNAASVGVTLATQMLSGHFIRDGH